MAQENNIAQQLNDLLVTRNFHPDMRDSQGKVCDSSEAKVFTFDYVSGSGKDYGTMVIILDSGNDLKAMFGNNLGRGMEDADKDEWFEFQQQLSQFANSHRWTYTGDDISKLKYTMQGLAAIKEGLFEGYYGTRRISYAGEPTEARLMIRHNRNLGENDARFRYVESIFVETADGERHRLPFTNLAGGRAMLEHVRQGGKPYDVRGNHICEMITELKVLARFNRASQGRVVEGVKQSVVQGAQTYYKSLRENIKRLSSPRGYTAYFESWHPASITEQDQLVEDIKTLFIEQTIDDRIEQALPLLAKIQQGREMKEAEIFENWVNNVTEGTWSLPETPEQMTKLKELMSGELIVGPDGTNATEQLYDLIGDDVLFDRIDALAAQDPRANVWDDTEIQARLQELGIQMPNNSAPDMAAQPEQGVAEDSHEEQVARLAAYNEKMAGENPPIELGLREVGNWAKVGHYGDPIKTAWFNIAKYGLRNNKFNDSVDQAMLAIGDFPDKYDLSIPEIDTLYSAYETVYDQWEQSKSQRGMSEADNIAAFESLQRMRHLSGMKLKENVLNDAGSTLAHIMTTYQRDVRDFSQTGEMSSDLYDALYDYYFDDMPYGVKKARSGDPYEWISDRFAEDILSNAPVDTPHQSDGQTVGQVMSQVGTRRLSGRPAPLTECNSTMEGHFCPVHGLSECWSQGMYEDILSTGIQLAEDMTDVGDVVGQATRSAHDYLGQAANNIYEPIGNFIKGVKQGYNGKAQTDTTQPAAAVATPVRSPNITTRDLPGEPGHYAPNGAYIVNGREIPRIEVTGPYKTHDDSMDEASKTQTMPQMPGIRMPTMPTMPTMPGMSGMGITAPTPPTAPTAPTPPTPPSMGNFGSNDQLQRLMKLAGMYRAGNRSSLQKSTNDLLARMTGQDKSSAADVAPSFKTPGAAHAGQGGSDYQDEEPKGQAHSGQQGYDYQDEEPKGQAHSGQGGSNYYNYDDADQSSAETARLGRSGATAQPNDRRMNDADWINSQNPDNPKGQAHAGQGGYDYSDEAEPNDRKMNDANYINSLNPNGAEKPPRDLGLPPGELDKNSWDDMMKSVPGLDNNAWADLMRGNVSEADRAPPLPNRRVASVKSLDNAPPLPNSRVEPVDVTRESREGDALLARIKSLALIR